MRDEGSFHPSSLPKRQADAERAAATDLGLDLDGAAVVADDSEADRQPQARPLADRLGREDRPEQPRPMPRAEAAAVALDPAHAASPSPPPSGEGGRG